MIERAVQLGPHIGVIATNRTTLEPTRQMLLARALENGAIPGEGVPVLSSPYLALEQISHVFEPQES